MTRLRKRLLAGTIAALAIAGEPAARAQNQGDLAGAQALLDEGNRAAAAGDFATALERFRAAYGRYQSPTILLNIGAALRRLGRNPEAAVVYEKYLRGPSVPPDRAAEVRRTLGEIDATVARVTIGSTDTGARVWVDGSELLGFAPGGTVRLAPGPHTIAAGRASPQASEVVNVGAGEARSVFLRLATAPPAAVPPVPPPVVVVVPQDSDEDRPARKRRRGSMGPLKTAGVVLDVVGGLSMAGALGAGVVALVRDRDASRHCLGGGPACEPRALELEKSSQAASRASLTLLGVGGALVITGGILQAVDRGARDDDARALPRIGVGPIAGGGFMTLEATW